MENQTQTTAPEKIEKASVGALLIMLGAGIAFVNAIASYAFGLQYVDFKFFGFLGMFLHVAQSLAMLYLGISLYNKKNEKLAVAGVLLSELLTAAFAVLVRFSSNPILFQMNDNTYRENGFIAYIIFLICFVTVVILSSSEKEGADFKKPLIYCGVLLIISFFAFYTEDLQGIQFAFVLTYIVEALGLLLHSLHKINGKFSIAQSLPITKKAFLRILIVMAVATAIMIPISFDLNDGFGSRDSAVTEKECQVCDKEYKDDTNKKYISRTNMCKGCYFNFCSMTNREPKIY